jgi:hypothetical protein
VLNETLFFQGDRSMQSTIRAQEVRDQEAQADQRTMNWLSYYQILDEMPQ